MNLTAEQTEAAARVYNTYHSGSVGGALVPDAAAEHPLVDVTVGTDTVQIHSAAAPPLHKATDGNLYDMATWLKAAPGARWLFKYRTHAVDVQYALRAYVEFDLSYTDVNDAEGFEGELVLAA